MLPKSVIISHAYISIGFLVIAFCGIVRVDYYYFNIFLVVAVTLNKR